jgi:SAM-dependent methyltransferase
MAMDFDDGSAVWGSPHGLGELTLWRDFDYATSMVASLRRYLFEHATVPQWNYLLCGGKPELANPNSWAYAWPSLLAYALPPNAAVLAFIGLMSALGLLGCYLLFARWTQSRAGALAGATLFVFNGYFASHFNQGHVNFSLFHLVPWMLLVFDRAVEHRSRWNLALSWLLAWMFFSTALPHGIIHFYPAFVLYVGIFGLTEARRRGFWNALGPVLGALLPHGLGILASTYRLWPIAKWQMDHPRQGVVEEAYGALDVLGFTQRWVEDYRSIAAIFSGQVWGYWEYNNYVGPAALAVGVLGLVGALTRSRQGLGSFRLAVYAGLLIALGLGLSLGNGRLGTPGQLFRHLPVLSGVRVFTRYQVLMTFALALLVAMAFAGPLLQRVARPLRRWVAAAAAVLVCGPPLWAAARIASRIQAISYAEIASQYELPPPGVTPLSIAPKAINHQTFFLERGYFIARCYEPLNLGKRWMGAPLQAGVAAPLSLPVGSLGAPELERDAIRLRLPPEGERFLALRLSLPPAFEASLAGNTSIPGLYAFDRGQPPGDELVLRAVLPADRQGLAVSLVSFGLAVVLISLSGRKKAGGGRRGSARLGEGHAQGEAEVSEAFQPPRHVAPEGAWGWSLFQLRRALDLQVRTIDASVRAFASQCGDTVFDVGCGQMPYRGVFVARGLRYVGVDFAGRDSFRYDAADVLVFDGERLPMADASVGHVLCTEVLEHVPRPQQLVDELFRVMKPGATGLVTVPWAARYHYIPHDYFRYTPSALRQLFCRFGAVRIEARGAEWAVVYQKSIAVLMRGLRPGEAKGAAVMLWGVNALVTLPAVVGLLPLAFILANFQLWIGRRSYDDPLGYSVIFTKREADGLGSRL